MVALLPIGAPDYDRGEWPHWTDQDGDCQDTRHVVLTAESRTAVTYRTDRRCRVKTGQWYGAFTGQTITSPSDLDVDHLVPLDNAHRSGGWAWSGERKCEYANNLTDPDHLTAVTSGANRSKRAKGPERLRPPGGPSWCRYATGWTTIKATWSLTVTQPELTVLRGIPGTCPSPPQVEVMQKEDKGPVQETAGQPAEAGQTAAYGSCGEAEAAGEDRIRGSKGKGSGFPRSMPPGVRDGDGDGVVCEC